VAVAGLDLDLVRLGRLRHWRGHEQHPVLVPGLDLVEVDRVGENDLTGEGALGPLADEELQALLGLPAPLGLIVRTFRSTVRSTEAGSMPGRSKATSTTSPRRQASIGIQPAPPPVG
jgi:hypothetical protein